jgi:hypothetical protein
METVELTAIAFCPDSLFVLACEFRLKVVLKPVLGASVSIWFWH